VQIDLTPLQLTKTEAIAFCQNRITQQSLYLIGIGYTNNPRRLEIFQSALEIKKAFEAHLKSLQWN
jgi:hypothetical protein